MTNMEVCNLLVEAAELLNESTRYDIEMSKRGNYTSSKEHGDIAAKHISKAKKSQNKLDQAVELKKSSDAIKMGENTKKHNIEGITKVKDIELDKKYPTVSHYTHSEEFMNKVLNNIINNSNHMDKEELKKKLKEYKNRKSHNKTITGMLTEAALLLNESVDSDMHILNESIFKKINEKAFTSKKEMDEIIKQYTSIEGLHKYANKADAIVEFTSIKQGLNVDGSFSFTIKKVNNAHVMYAFGKDKEDTIIFVYIAITDKKGKVKAIERTATQLKKIIKKKSK